MCADYFKNFIIPYCCDIFFFFRITQPECADFCKGPLDISNLFDSEILLSKKVLKFHKIFFFTFYKEMQKNKKKKKVTLGLGGERS
jgi:hypothetical protein